MCLRQVSCDAGPLTIQRWKTRGAEGVRYTNQVRILTGNILVHRHSAWVFHKTCLYLNLGQVVKLDPTTCPLKSPINNILTPLTLSFPELPVR